MPDPQLTAAVEAKIDQGDVLLNNDDFSGAADLYRQALALIPEPKTGHEVALPAFTALGEAYYFAGDYPTALPAFQAALKAPGGVENPLAHLRLGQVYYELGDRKNAAQHFTIAYGLDGRDVFEGEDE